MAVEIEIIKPGVTLLNGLQNTVTLTTPNSTLNIGTSGQDITLDINLGTANTWTGLQTFNGNANFNGTNLQITSQYVLFNEGLSGTNPFTSFGVNGAISGGVLGQSDFDFFGNSAGSGFHWFSVNDTTGVLTSLMQLNVNGALTSYKNTLDDGSGNMTITGTLTLNGDYVSNTGIEIISNAGAGIILNEALTTNYELISFTYGGVNTNPAWAIGLSGTISTIGIGYTSDLSTTDPTNYLTVGSSGALNSYKNTLDDGSGNIGISGYLGVGSSTIGGGSPTLFSGTTAINGGNQASGISMAGRPRIGDWGYYLTIGEPNGTSGGNIIQVSNTGVHTGTSTGIAVAPTLRNTLDDGSGNMTVTGHVSAPVLSGNLTVYTSGSGTYTVPAGCSVIKVILVGGGGGGQGGDGEEERTAGEWVAGNGGNGGGAGGATEATFYVTAGQTFSYAVGAGGAGGSGGATDCSGTTATNGGSGSNGGNSTFAFLTADGGAGGTSSGAGGGGSSPNPIAFAGGAGKAGSAGVGSTTACVDATGGNGGAGGSNELIYTGSYGNGGAGGKGGGGGADGQAGSAGTDGAIIIEQF